MSITNVMEKGKIKTTVSHNSTLMEEFKCSRQTVYSSLKGHYNSELAKKIRARYKELIAEELKVLENYEKGE